MAEVSYTSRELPAPTIDNPDNKVVQVTYRKGELPPGFLVIPKAEFSEEEVQKRIKADLERREAVEPTKFTL